MLAYGIDANTHAGIKTMLSLRFVKTGLLDIQHGKTFMLLFESRQSGDYEDFVYCDAELYSSLKPKAEELICEVKKLIKGKISFS